MTMGDWEKSEPERESLEPGAGCCWQAAMRAVKKFDMKKSVPSCCKQAVHLYSAAALKPVQYAYIGAPAERPSYAILV